MTTVVSLGDDQRQAVSLRHLNDSAVTGRARLFIAGKVISGNTPEEAMSIVDSNHHMGVDFMKIRVDDNLGTSKKMSEEVYRAVINRSHELGYKVATHIYYLEDAKKLLDAGSDLIAHSVRDLPVDESFIELIRRKDVAYCPTLTREVSAFALWRKTHRAQGQFFRRHMGHGTKQQIKSYWPFFRFTGTPPMYTPAIFLTLPISRSGSASRTRKSAQLRADSVPRLRSPRYLAASRVAETMICIGVSPASAIICISMCSKYPMNRVGTPLSVPKRIGTPAAETVLRLARASGNC